MTIQVPMFPPQAGARRVLPVRKLDLVPRLVDFGAVETVVMGVGRVQLIGSDMIRFALYDETAGTTEEGDVERAIKSFQTWPLQHWLAAQHDCAGIVRWVEESLAMPAGHVMPMRIGGASH